MKTASIRRLYASSAASTNDAAHFDMPYDAVLIGIEWSISSIGGVAGDRCAAEVSTASVCQATTNDCISVLSNADYTQAITANGVGPGVNKYAGPLNLGIPRGTRIYLHTIQAGVTATQIRVNLQFQPA